MYCFDGLYRQCLWVVLVAILCVGYLVASRFWSREKMNKRHLATGVFWLLATIYMVWYFIGAIISPNIVSHEGTLLSGPRASRSFTMEYSFSNDDGLKPVIKVDPFTEKKICPQGLEEGKTYRVYYEARTYIMVKIEEIEP